MRGFISKISLDVLTKTEQDVFSKLSLFKTYGYLAGGTALALQLKHRRSYDFDVFVKKPIQRLLRRKVDKVFGKVDFYVDTSEQISFKTREAIAVTFFTYYFPRIAPSVRGGTIDTISLASVLDIAADKAHAIGRRAVWRDYVDLFIVLRKGVALGYLCELAKEKFGGAFNEALFLEQLCYFKDTSETPIEFLKEFYTPSEIKSFLEKEVEKYVRKILP